MGKMAEVMPYPRNTISMKGATGPFGDYISMGGLFTIVKVRDRLTSYDEDPGWYQHPPGTVARQGERRGSRAGRDRRHRTECEQPLVYFQCEHGR